MRFCFNCMEEIGDNHNICPHCGTDIAAYVQNQRALTPMTILNGKYIVGKVIGEGGFGITYTDIKTTLSVLSGSSGELFQKGLERFIEEANNLAKFNNLHGIVSVNDFSMRTIQPIW